MAYNSQCCANCDNYNYNKVDSDGKCWCNKFDEYKYPTHDCGYGFSSAGRDSEDIKSTIDESDYKRGPVHWGFGHITTAIYQILGLKKDEVYNNIIFLRDEVMEKDPKYRNVLNKYDDLGRKIAENMKLDDVRENGEMFSKATKLCFALYESFILPVSKLVKEERYDEAISMYWCMFDILIEEYAKKENTVSLSGMQYRKMDYLPK